MACHVNRGDPCPFCYQTVKETIIQRSTVTQGLCYMVIKHVPPVYADGESPTHNDCYKVIHGKLSL